MTDNDQLRVAISALWRSSNFGIQKDVATLWGPILGDLFLKVIDDPAREQVYLDLVHPALISNLELDRFGNIKGYEIVETREHPEEQGRSVTYTETLLARGGGRERLLRNAA